MCVQLLGVLRLDPHSTLIAVLESPALVERAAHAIFVADGDGTDDWAALSDQFREVYRSEVRVVVGVLVELTAPVRAAA